MRAKASWVLIAVFALVVALVPAWSQAPAGDQDQPPAPPQRGMMMQRMGPGGNMMWKQARPNLKEALGLTEEQESQLRSLRFEAAKAGIQAHSDLMVKRLELRQLLDSDTPNQGAVDKAVRAVADAQYSLMKQRVDSRLAMRKVLTPEQYKKWKEMRHHFHAFRHGRGMGPGMMGPGMMGPGMMGPGMRMERRQGPGGPSGELAPPSPDQFQWQGDEGGADFAFDDDADPLN